MGVASGGFGGFNLLTEITLAPASRKVLRQVEPSSSLNSASLTLIPALEIERLKSLAKGSECSTVSAESTLRIATWSLCHSIIALPPFFPCLSVILAPSHHLPPHASFQNSASKLTDAKDTLRRTPSFPAVRTARAPAVAAYSAAAVDDLLIPLARRDVIAELPAERRLAAVVPVRFIA